MSDTTCYVSILLDGFTAGGSRRPTPRRARPSGALLSPLATHIRFRRAT
jgi:hypothetical protein